MNNQPSPEAEKYVADMARFRDKPAMSKSIDSSWTPKTPEGLSAWYKGDSTMRDWCGRWHWLNAARDITFWRKARTWLGFPESDTMTGFMCKEFVVDLNP